MKLYALYFSPTGGTKKVLDTVLSVWDCEKEYINLSDASYDYEELKFEEKDVCVIAVPSFSGRVPQFIIPKIRKMKGNRAKAVLIVSYGNRAFDDTLLELKNETEASGFCCAAGLAAVTQHSIVPRFGFGRPDKEDREELERFARRCKEATEGAVKSVNVPGNIPYRPCGNGPIKPMVDRALCNECGICESMCPVNAISVHDLYHVDEDKCISCLQCMKICPQNARYVDEDKRKAIEDKIEKACSEKKENQLFFVKTA